MPLALVAKVIFTISEQLIALSDPRTSMLVLVLVSYRQFSMRVIMWIESTRSTSNCSEAADVVPRIFCFSTFLFRVYRH